MNTKDIKDLILTIDKTSIEEVEIERSDIRLVICKKTKGIGNNERVITNSFEGQSISIDNTGKKESKVKANDEKSNGRLEEDENIYILKSPIVGTFYEASSPDSEPFVKVGARVKEGQTLCIVEAMKIMNEIECEVEGEVVEILVKDEDIVEYGQPLMVIRR